MTSAQVDVFLRRLTQSHLLDAAQMRGALVLAQKETVPERVAQELVAENHLTRWQARQLLSGHKTRFFLDRYKLLKEMGRGAKGIVYKAIHPAMNRIVAVKVMSKEILHDQTAIARFQREIRAVAVLDHPQIVRALDAGCEKETYYLVMEHIAGKDLRYWIKSASPLPIAWSCECIRQAALGLQHAYEKGIVHRDIKPSNLILNAQGVEDRPQIKIVDFGLAQVGDDNPDLTKLTRMGFTVGTVAYMAPEQARDSVQVDVRSDIFSLGCTLFQMLSAELPFQGKSDLEMMMLRNKRDAARIKSIRHDVPIELEEIIARMLARDPAQRFQTPAEVAAALEPFSQQPQASSASVAALPESEPDDAQDNHGSGTDSSWDQFLGLFSDSTSSRIAAGHSNFPARKHHSRWLPIAIVMFFLMVLFGILALKS